MDLWENVEVGELDMLGALHDAVGILVTTPEFSFEELLAVIIKSEIVDGHAKDVLVVTCVILKGFLCQYFCILFLVQKMIIEGALEVEGGFHNSGAKVFDCSSNHKFATFFSWHSCWIV
jgi:hypothetical protein